MTQPSSQTLRELVAKWQEKSEDLRDASPCTREQQAETLENCADELEAALAACRQEQP
jgi:hypothetical protein